MFFGVLVLIPVSIFNLRCFPIRIFILNFIFCKLQVIILLQFLILLIISYFWRIWRFEWLIHFLNNLFLCFILISVLVNEIYLSYRINVIEERVEAALVCLVILFVVAAEISRFLYLILVNESVFDIFKVRHFPNCTLLILYQIIARKEALSLWAPQIPHLINIRIHRKQLLLWSLFSLIRCHKCLAWNDVIQVAPRFYCLRLFFINFPTSTLTAVLFWRDRGRRLLIWQIGNSTWHGSLLQ